MKHQTAELSGALLDAAVASIAGFPLRHHPMLGWQYAAGGALVPRFSTDWSVGGPIMERENCVPRRVEWREVLGPGRLVGHPRTGEIKQVEWVASWGREEPPDEVGIFGDSAFFHCGEVSGPTMLVAAMRAFVASKLGPEVDLPDGDGA